MTLTGYVVRIWLTQSGFQELQEPFGGASEFEALVIDEDASGIWIAALSQTRTGQPFDVQLLRWEYVATLSLQYQPPAPVEKPRVGF